MPLRRYIFNTLTVMSLLLLLATVGLWVDGFWNVTCVGQDQGGVCSSNRGVLLMLYRAKPGRWMWIRHQNQIGTFELFIEEDLYPEHGFMGFLFVGPISSISPAEYIARIPHWFLTLIFATLPAIWLFKWNKHRKLSPNACPACGYDLTGNETGKCPECGVANEKSANPANPANSVYNKGEPTVK